MKYAFGDFVLDAARFELKRDGRPVPVEPRVFDLLVLFVNNPGQVIDRDRMIAEVWEGRIVSDATLSTAVKSARKALGDSGETQSFIETVRSRGFRFSGDVAVESGARARVEDGRQPQAQDTPTVPLSGAPAIAVLPFARLGDPAPFGGLEEAVPHEVILALSRLRWLRVIARGSSFRFRSPKDDLASVGQALGVRYLLTGAIEVFGGRIAANVELTDPVGGGVIWGERFAGTIDDVHRIRADIVAGVASSVESQIPLNEAMMAQGKAPENLDAWQVFHLGLKQMHQYTEAGNEAAAAFFHRAVALEPGFARAHAGLSFTHFQSAFLRYSQDREAEIGAARQAAEIAVDLDPMDPFVNLNMGRCFWLRKDLDMALPWLERSAAISPSYAQGHYARAIVDAMCGRSEIGSLNVDLAMALSPLDPLLYGMRGAKALTNVTSGDFAEAARWADAAARTPRAHVIIDMIAAFSHALNGDDVAATRWVERVRERKPDANQIYFFDGLPVQDAVTRRRISGALSRFGF